MPSAPQQKNIIYGSITADGNVHIGDIIYNIERNFKSGSILFLRLDKTDDTQCTAHLSVKSKHSKLGSLASSGETWCKNIELNIPMQLLEVLHEFQTIRRGNNIQAYLASFKTQNPSNVIANIEHKLGQLILDTFFVGEIRKVCDYFIQQLEEKRIDELLLAISADDEILVNLPFEMALPLLFSAKLGETKKSLAPSNFGLVRTKITSPEKFKMQGEYATAAPLKMLFITALPENRNEESKILEIEKEQTLLIKSIGELEATGDKQPKIVIEFLDNASLAELDKALNARQHDIVHISGHGDYQAAQNKGVLYFENEDGDMEQVSGAALGETLSQHACVKLLILSACKTAIAGSEGGVAEQVATFGVPSIVAMRFAVTDEGAQIFTAELYTYLAKGFSLTRAIAYAREALLKDIAQLREKDPQSPAEWFIPVLYLNQSLGALINKTLPYNDDLLKNFYPPSSLQSRLIGKGFIGRKRYLIQLRHAFRAGRHVCLHGLGGLGKTTLAEAFAHNYDNRSHSILIFRNGTQINEGSILQIFQHAFAEINPKLSKQVQHAINDPERHILNKLQLLIDKYLKERKSILIFDNTEDVQTEEGSAYQRRIGSESLSTFLRYLCENTPQDCHIIFTTRYKIEDLADVLEHLPLDKMSYAEQYRLLNYSETLRWDIPQEEREQVYIRLDGLPRGYEYLEALLKKDKSFTWLQVSQVEAHVFENLLLEKVYERLSEREKVIFQIVAVFITRTPLAALAAVSGEAEADLFPVLQALQDWSLCFLEKDGRFEVHRLTREWIAQQIIPAPQAKEWALKAGEYFQTQAGTWDDLVLAKNYFELAEAWAQFTSISFHIQSHYQLIGLYRQAFELNQAVLAKNIDAKTNADALNYTGMILIRVGKYDMALPYLEQSMDIMRQISNRQGEGATLDNISKIYENKGEYDTALRYLEQSLAIRKEIDDLQGEGITLHSIGQIYLAKSKDDNALHYYEKSMKISQQIGDQQSEAATLNDINKIYANKGDYDTALRYLEQSLNIMRKIGNRQGEGTTLSNIGLIHLTRGDNDTALHYLEQSLEISRQIDDGKVEGTTLDNIGQIYANKGNNDTALHCYEKSLEIKQQIGDRQGQGITLNNIGQIYHDKGNHGTALLYYEKSLEINQEIRDQQGEGTTLSNIGLIYADKGDYDTALRYLSQSLKIKQQIGDINGMAEIMHNMGTISFKREDLEEATLYFIQAYKIFLQIKSPNVKDTESYLQDIIERIGESKFQEILSKWAK